MQNFILTGTPGSGKTTVLRVLEMQGYPVVEEAATDLITYEQMQGNPQPWKSSCFLDKILYLQKHRQKLALRNGICFYDRSPICTVALARFLKFEVTPCLCKEVERLIQESVYQNKVFFLDNLGFCSPSESRKINFEEALEFERIHLETYQEFGFSCVRIPVGSPLERANLILKALRKNTYT